MARQYVTIKDVAQRAGVSAGTVSNVLNKKSHVDPAIRERVENTIRLVGYRINMHARGMIKRRSFNAGIIIPSLSDPFFPRFADSIELDIEERGSNAIITSSRFDPRRERDLCELLMSKQVDGLIVTPCSRENIGYFNDLIAQGVSVVQLGRYFEGIQSPIVRAANREAGREAFSILHTYGHRRFIQLTGDPESSPDTERKTGFLERARELGLTDSVLCVQAIFNGEHRAYSVFRNAIAEKGDVTAVFATDDLTALGCLRVCRELNIDVPRELSMVSVGGFYDPYSTIQVLSTLAIDTAAMSSKAVEFLYRKIQNDEDSPVETGGAIDAGFGAWTVPAEIEDVPVRFVPGETISDARE
ncbi:MAG TPA: LacI family DNA-binding transcriptional regulator [Spirochaetia bacterium]|nr:LacI family DNA-binding transcriptional regulator [Spirochaetia bacterium]